MSKVLLEMNHITKTFPGVKALDDVNLRVEEGEIHAIVGENGAGKSTLMNVLSGIYPFGSYEGDIVSGPNLTLDSEPPHGSRWSPACFRGQLGVGVQTKRGSGLTDITCSRLVSPPSKWMA